MGNEWQERCTAELRRCIAMGAEKGGATWAMRRWKLFEEAQQKQGKSGRIIIADLDAEGENLRKFSFFSCYVIRCNFLNANLSGSDFELSIIRECNFSGANLERSTFQDADVAGKNQFLKVKTNGNINFSVIKADLPRLMDGRLVQMARRGWEIRDDRLHEGQVMRLLRKTLGYGLRVRNVVYASVLVIVAFTLAWMFSPLSEGEHFIERLGQSLLCSIRYFLGITEVFEKSSGFWAYVGLFETSVGLFLLAMLVAAFSKRFIIIE